MAFAIKRRPHPLMALISIHYLPHFFLLQLNLAYMKRILHLGPVKIFILKSSYTGSKLTAFFVRSPSFFSPVGGTQAPSKTDFL